ncbi:LOW QUALITY PROTEIN: hypothetical protein OSB04_007643 [Centaurea solstitialis]|uniref:Ribosome-recycling factor, chloroplastic n=1 Tax=Centaurea solstitialis TaxID=347529 RepID=A0AA38TK97_9ASTR|nr:LOW QUALITY PROTEIN: hypothetical protein OSB04_007643 [Centaurea solstitialis]
MAISMKRAVMMMSFRSMHPLLRTTRRVSHLSPSPYFLKTAAGDLSPISPPIDFLFESRRSFAKARKKWDDDDNGELDVSNGDAASRTEIVNIGPIIKSTAVSEMEAAIEAVSNELAKLRTGRASSGMLDHIIVETGMPLNRMAVVSVLDPKTLSVTPYNPNISACSSALTMHLISQALKELEKAIVSSPLGLNPKPDGERLIAAIPPMTKEHMQARSSTLQFAYHEGLCFLLQAVCKVVAKSSEDAKQRIRRARQKALDTIKKSVPKKSEGKDKGKSKAKAVSGFSADDAKRLEKEVMLDKRTFSKILAPILWLLLTGCCPFSQVDELTKKFSKSAEDICKAKEKEITSS